MSLGKSQIITKEMKWNANMTEQNHLGAMLIAQPHKMEGVVKELYSAKNYYSKNPMSSRLFNSKKSDITIGTTSWEWQMRSANVRPLVVVEDVESIANLKRGAKNRTFKIALDENFYLKGDVLIPGGASNKRYQVRIMENPSRQGDKWIYQVKLMTNDTNLFVPLKYFKVGTPWSKLYSQYGEGAISSGSTIFSSNITLMSRMSRFRKHYRVTDYASTEVLAVAVLDRKGQTHKMWIRYADSEYWGQWFEEVERGSWYTRSTDVVMDDTGRPVRSGPGIQELLEDSERRSYTHLTARMIEEYLMDIYYSRTAPGKASRETEGFSGEYGMINFHRAIDDVMSKNGFIKNSENFMNKESSDYHNGYAFGYKFVKYYMANGASLKLTHNPIYDDNSINSEVDELTGYPVESQRISFFDFAGANSKESNVKLVNKKDGFAFGYVEGLYGPYGPKKGGNAAHAGAFYEMHVDKTFGVQIDDVTSCGELYLDRA